MIDLIQVGARIKATRKAKGLSQFKLAEKSGVSRARIEALENARIAEIGFNHLLRILNVLDLELRLIELTRARPMPEDPVDEEARSDTSRLDRTGNSLGFAERLVLARRRSS